MPGIRRSTGRVLPWKILRRQGGTLRFQRLSSRSRILENPAHRYQKTYSSVPPSFAAPRYRNSSTDIAGVVSKRVIRIVANFEIRNPSVKVEFAAVHLRDFFLSFDRYDDLR